MINHMLTSSLVIIFVLLTGKLFEEKISSCLKYSLWLLVVVKLLLPFPGFASEFHILTMIESYIDINQNPFMNMTVLNFWGSNTGGKDNNQNYGAGSALEHDFTETTFTAVNKDGERKMAIEKGSENNVNAMIAVIKVIYGIGFCICLGVMFISNIRFAQKVKEKRIYLETYQGKIPVYKLETYPGACLYGGFRPVMIIGNNPKLTIEQQNMIMLHEYVHYVHGDPIWSMVRSLCTALYWYNPLVWLAAFVSQADSELACDEGTIKRIGKGKRITYGQTLLQIIAESSGRKDLLAAVFFHSTVAGGKEEMKKRISRIAKGRKTSSSALLCICFLSLLCIGCTFGEPIDKRTIIERKESGIRGIAETQDWESPLKEMQQETKEQEEEIGDRTYVWPTESRVISAMFGEREHPITGEKIRMDYLGIAGIIGESVYAVADGEILDVGFDSKLGSYLVLLTSSGETVTYGHLDGSKVFRGAKVKAGEIIGKLGRTGSATGAFLSLSVEIDGVMMDPMLYLPAEKTEERILYEGKEYRKSELSNDTLIWLELPEEERKLSSYFPPEFGIVEETWGVVLTVEQITATGVTLNCVQSGGEPSGRLQTGSWYILERWTQNEGWKEMPYILEGNIGWTQEAWMIPMEGTCIWQIDWEWLYGAVPEGKYRIGKSIMDFRESGDFDRAVYYAEFNLPTRNQ